LIGCAGLGADRWLLADLFLVPIFFAAFTLDAKTALAEVSSIFVALCAVLLTSDYAYAPVRIVITACVVISVSSLLLKAHDKAREFATEAVSNSAIDALTGAGNLRGLRARVAEEIDRNRQLEEATLVILSIDLDDFKSVNDRHSHSRGDNTLVAVTHAIESQLRADDLVARRGGDEFSVVANLDPPGDARALVRRISSAIETARIELCPDVMPTASIGVTKLRDDESLDEFLARCDEDLHRSKVHSRADREAFPTTDSRQEWAAA
jgi:diguanylate cyclase (GGDEF)-like protein